VPTRAATLNEGFMNIVNSLDGARRFSFGIFNRAAGVTKQNTMQTGCYSETTHSSYPSKTVVFVTGQTGDLGSGIFKKIKEADNSNYRPIGLSRLKPVMIQLHDLARVNIMTEKLITNDYKNPNSITESSQIQLEPGVFENPDALAMIINSQVNKGDKVIFVNTIGGAHPQERTEKGFKKLNYDPTIVCADALKLCKKELSFELTFIQISSIMATLAVDDLYGRVKADVDNKLLTEYEDINPISLRLGYIIGATADKNGRGHLFAGEDLAVLPLQPVVEDGNQVILVTTINDIATFILKSLEFEFTKENRIIYGINAERKSQIEFLKFYTTLYGRTFKKLNVDLEDFKWITNVHPKGHLTPYACSYFGEGWKQKLDHKPFERIIGRKLETMNDYYKVSEESILREERATPLIVQYCFDFTKKCYTNRELPKLVGLVCKYSWRALSSLMPQIGNGKSGQKME
jgi:hypothetical protein